MHWYDMESCFSSQPKHLSQSCRNSVSYLCGKSESAVLENSNVMWELCWKTVVIVETQGREVKITWRIADLFPLLVSECSGGTKSSLLQKIACSLLTGSSDINFVLKEFSRSVHMTWKSCAFPLNSWLNPCRRCLRRNFECDETG